jgi:hypothetical protein
MTITTITLARNKAPWIFRRTSEAFARLPLLGYASANKSLDPVIVPLLESVPANTAEFGQAAHRVLFVIRQNVSWKDESRVAKKLNHDMRAAVRQQCIMRGLFITKNDNHFSSYLTSRVKQKNGRQAITNPLTKGNP